MLTWLVQFMLASSPFSSDEAKPLIALYYCNKNSVISLQQQLDHQKKYLKKTKVSIYNLVSNGGPFA